MSQHFEIPVAIFIFGMMQSLAAINLLDLMHQGLGIILMLASIVWMVVQSWSKIRLTKRELGEDEE